MMFYVKEMKGNKNENLKEISRYLDAFMWQKDEQKFGTHFLKRLYSGPNDVSVGGDSSMVGLKSGYGISSEYDKCSVLDETKQRS